MPMRWRVVWTMWLAAVLAGFGGLMREELTPGDPAGGPATWPQASSLTRWPGEPLLLVFLHPRCPCSRATVRELGRLLDTMPRLLVDVVVWAPPVVPSGWSPSALDVGRLGGRVHEDAGGVETTRFGVRTSGSVLIYDADGRLAYEGGVTRGRGLEGACEAGAALSASLKRVRTATHRPVFGCPLAPASEGTR